MEFRHIKHMICVFVALFCGVKMANDCFFRTGTICNVMEGNTIDLSCRINNLEPVIIYKDLETDFVIVKDDMLKVDAEEYRYHVVNNITEKTHILTIYNVSRSYKGQYYCLQTKPQVDSKSVELRVFHPSSKISCDTDSSFTIFKEDKIQTPFDGKCSVYDGYPSVDMSFAGISDSFEMNSTTNRFDGKIEGRFSVFPNVNLNNSVVSCIIRQHYPTDLNLPDHVSDCSFKPFLFLTEFAVWITPSNVTIHSPQDIHFVCSSNAENIEKVSWILSKLPTGVSHSENSKRLILHIQEEESLTDRSIAITIKCHGYYRNRTNEYETFAIINLQRVETSPAIVIVILFLIFLLVLPTIILYRKEKWRNNNRKLSCGEFVGEYDPATDQVCNKKESSSGDDLDGPGPSPGQRCSEKADYCGCFSKCPIRRKLKGTKEEGYETKRNLEQSDNDGSKSCYLAVYKETIIEDKTYLEDYETVGNSTTTGNNDWDSKENQEYQIIEIAPH